MNYFYRYPCPVSQGFGVRKLYSGGKTHVRRPRRVTAHQSASLSVA